MGRQSRVVLVLVALSLGCTGERRQTTEARPPEFELPAPPPIAPNVLEAIRRAEQEAAARKQAVDDQQERVERKRKAQEAAYSRRAKARRGRGR